MLPRQRGDFAGGAQQLLEVRGSRSPCCLLARFDAFFGREMSEGGRPRRERRPIVRDEATEQGEPHSRHGGKRVGSAARRSGLRIV